MKNGSRMARYMMMNNSRRAGDNERHDMRDNRTYNRGMDVDNRFRDKRGREHYDNGRYAPMKNNYDHDMDMRYRGDTSGRTRYEGGGYIEYDHGGGYDWPMDSMDNDSWDKDKSWDDDKGRVIGFASAVNSKSHSTPPMTREMADEWMTKIRNEDGTKGAHWSIDEVKRVMHQKGIECDPVKLWVAVNAEYSDRQAINKKYGVDKLDFYIDSAIAYWLKDQDAVKDKLAAYYTHVVKH